jgi:hypothetical protein
MKNLYYKIMDKNIRAVFGVFYLIIASVFGFYGTSSLIVVIFDEDRGLLN